MARRGPTGWAVAVVSAAVFAVAPGARAAPGDLDPGFSRDGKMTFDYGTPHGVVDDAAVDGQGRIYVSGSTEYGGDGAADIVVTRLAADGELDPGFEGGGTVLDLGGGESARSVAPAPGGGVYVAIAREVPVDGNLSVLKLGDDGRPDPGFAGDGIASIPVDPASATARELVAAPGGGVIVAGTVGSGSGRDIALARLAPDGSPDPALGGDGSARVDLGQAESVYAVAVDAAGRILVGGVAGTSQTFLARLTPAGEIDAGFSGDGSTYLDIPFLGATTDVPTIAALSDGRIVVMRKGRQTGSGISGSSSLVYTQTYDASGSGVSSSVLEGALGDVVALPGGDFVLASSLDRVYIPGNRAVFRSFVVDHVLADGAHDPEWGIGGPGSVWTDFGRRYPYGLAKAAAVGPDGRIVVAGNLGGAGPRIAVARYLDEPGIRDPDADGLLVGADRCEHSFGTAEESGCEVLQRELTAIADPRRGPRGRFAVRGTLADDCRLGGTVEVFRKRGRGRGPKLIGEDETDKLGDYRLRPIYRRGRYFARVGQTITELGVCPTTRSRAVRVR